MDEREAFTLTQSQIDAFHRDGFISIPQLTVPEEVDRIRTIYDQLFSERRGWNEGNFFDFVAPDAPDATPSLPQLLTPSKYEQALERTLFKLNAERVARQLLGPKARLVFEHAIMKPPKVGPPTPWHQDQAFFPAGTNYESITIWMPLQDVEAQSGCMQYIPGSHKLGLKTHRPLNDDPRIHALEAIDADVSTAVVCPLKAGGATVHDYRTLHGAGPNAMGIPRRAYALGFGVRSKNIRVTEEYPWNAKRETARHSRYLESRSVIQHIHDRLYVLKARLGL